MQKNVSWGTLLSTLDPSGMKWLGSGWWYDLYSLHIIMIENRLDGGMSMQTEFWCEGPRKTVTNKPEEVWGY